MNLTYFLRLEESRQKYAKIRKKNCTDQERKHETSIFDAMDYGFLITFKGFLTTAMIMIVLPTNATEAKTTEIAPFTSKTVAWNPMAK